MGWFEDNAGVIGGAVGGLVGGPTGAMIGYGMGSSLSASYQNRAMQQQTNDLNVQMAREQMNFQREMSNTAHQREVGDLVAAGLNPTLSAGGNGSSTPSGSSPSLQAPQLMMPDFMSMGMQLMSLEQNKQKLNIDQQNADTAEFIAGLKEKSTAADVSKKEQDTQLAKAKTLLAKKGAPRAILESEGADLIQKGLKWLKEKFQTDAARDPNKVFKNQRSLPDEKRPPAGVRNY